MGVSEAGTCAAASRSSLEAVVGGNPRISGLILGFRPSQARSLPTSAAQLAGLAVPDVAGLIRSGVFRWPVRGAGRHSNHSEKERGGPVFAFLSPSGAIGKCKFLQREALLSCPRSWK